MSTTTTLAGAALVVTATAMLALGSSAPLTLQRTPEAMIRVAFSARPERLETCREMDAEELAALPTHMQQSVVCEGRTASYKLDVWHNGTMVASANLHGGGLRRDRQLYALQEVLIPAGSSVVEVRMTRVDSLESGDSHQPVNSGTSESTMDPSRAAREADERRRRMEGEVPPSLELRETVVLAPRGVLLVTYDQSSRQLRTMRDPK
ncbi:MAG TPA: hypothetical protein VKZ41_12550 [Gemmatimonadales bacterium]|nr:hypothetical protein [Gemmatimonadales bacterium]